MGRGLLWLVFLDLRQSWLRAGLAALVIALAILAVAFFAHQIGLRQAEVLASYEQTGAATLVVDLSGIADRDIDTLAAAVRSLGGVRSVAVPYGGISLGIVADTSFLVFQNDQQEEYLGARTNVLGVDRPFDHALDYYVNFHSLTPDAPQAVFGIPLRPTAGAVRVPQKGELLVASGVADYVGVRPDAQATVELVYTGVDPPIVQRLEGLRLIGTFDVVGPDEGRFDPFWRFAARGRNVLTVRAANTSEKPATTLPVMLSRGTLQEFVELVERELEARGQSPRRPLQRDQLVIRANSINDVPTAEAATRAFLQQRGLRPGCDFQRPLSFCLRLPERNNFQAALREQNKLGSGGEFFLALLLGLVTIGTAGLQVQAVLARWHDYGVLQALGFTPGQVLQYFGLQILSVLIGAIAIAIAALALPVLWSTGTPLNAFAWAAGASGIATSLAARPVLLWPLSRVPAELLREAA